MPSSDACSSRSTRASALLSHGCAGAGSHRGPTISAHHRPAAAAAPAEVSTSRRHLAAPRPGRRARRRTWCRRRGADCTYEGTFRRPKHSRKRTTRSRLWPPRRARAMQVPSSSEGAMTAPRSSSSSPRTSSCPRCAPRWCTRWACSCPAAPRWRGSGPRGRGFRALHAPGGMAQLRHERRVLGRGAAATRGRARAARAPSRTRVAYESPARAPRDTSQAQRIASVALLAGFPTAAAAKLDKLYARASRACATSSTPRTRTPSRALSWARTRVGAPGGDVRRDVGVVEQRPALAAASAASRGRRLAADRRQRRRALDPQLRRRRRRRRRRGGGGGDGDAAAAAGSQRTLAASPPPPRP